MRQNKSRTTTRQSCAFMIERSDPETLKGADELSSITKALAVWFHAGQVFAKNPCLKCCCARHVRTDHWKTFALVNQSLFLVQYW